MSFLDFGWLLVFAFLGLGVFVLSQNLFGYWFTPISAFVGMICLSVCGYHLRLLQMSDVSAETHLVVLGSVGAFMAGSLVGRGGGSLAPVAHVAQTVDAEHLDQFFRITTVLATFGWMLGLFILVGKIGVGGLLANIWLLQDHFQIQFIGYLNLLGILVLPTFVLKVGLGRARRRDVAWTLAALFGLVLAGIKSYTVYSVLASLFCWSVVQPRRFRPWHVAAGFGVLLAFFIAYTARIDIFTRELYVGSSWFDQFRALHRPYIYFVGAWPAMDNIIMGVVKEAHQVGSVTLQPFYKVFGSLLGVFNEAKEGMPYSDIGTSLFNVYSFPGEVYWDWKLPGVLLLSAGYGFVATRMYVRTRRLAYWGHILAYGIIGYGLMLSCFMYTIRFKLFFLLGYVWIVGFVIARGGMLIGPNRTRSGTGADPEGNKA